MSLSHNRERRIMEIVEGINYEIVRNCLNALSNIIDITHEASVKGLDKLIDDMQELESNVTGIPIK